MRGEFFYKPHRQIIEISGLFRWELLNEFDLQVHTCTVSLTRAVSLGFHLAAGYF